MPWRSDDQTFHINSVFDGLIDEFREKFEQRKRAEAAVGLHQVERAEEMAFAAYLAAHRAVFEHWPVAAAERAALATYLVSLLIKNDDVLSDEQLAMIFGAKPDEQAQARDEQHERNDAYFRTVSKNDQTARS